MGAKSFLRLIRTNIRKIQLRYIIDLDYKLKKAEIFEKKWIGRYYQFKAIVYFILIIAIIVVILSILNPDFLSNVFDSG